MKKNRYFIWLLSVCLLCSCEGFLDQNSRSQVDADKMFDTDQGFKDALTACYVKMNSETLYGQALTMTRIELMAQHWDLDRSNFRTMVEFKDLDFTTDDSRSFFSSVFGAQYNVIVQANDVLKNLPSKGHNITSPTTRAIIEAEALTIRAFCHFDILRMFGQMPYNPQKTVKLPYAETVSKESIPYYDNDAFMGLILRDLNTAEALFNDHDPLVDYAYSQLEEEGSTALIDDSFLNYRRFRFNLYAVKALKARLYLYWGKTSEAYNCAKEVINAVSSTGDRMISLAGEADLNQNWFGLPTECLFALNNFQLSGEIFAIDSYRLNKTHFDELFAQRNASSNNRMLKVWNGNASSSTGTLYPLIKKYNQPETGESVTTNNLVTRRQVIPILRLSEMYLIVMETGTLAEANQLYVPYMLARNEVVQGDLTQAQLDDLIVGEYRREFFAEGQMFYYYKRKGSSTMIWQSSDIAAFTESNYVVPIPESEMKAN